MSEPVYFVDKTVTEKLEKVLNDLAEKGRTVLHAQYVGGRDWAIISKRELVLSAIGEGFSQGSTINLNFSNGESRTYSPPCVGDAVAGETSYMGISLAAYDNATCKQIHPDGSVEPLSDVWSGYIEDEARSWILFLDGRRRPALYYPRRDCEGAVMGEPVTLA